MPSRMQLTVGDQTWSTDPTDPTPLSIRLEFGGEQPRAFGLDPAIAEPIGFDGDLADTEAGGEFNCKSVRLIPHGNGTHTESVGHLVSDAPPVGELVAEAFLPTSVLTVPTTALGESGESYAGPGEPGDRVVTRRALIERLWAMEVPGDFMRALVIRTEPNETSKRTRDHSQTNPPYLTSEAVALMREWQVEHLLVDLPSIDREHDEGELSNHRAFWSLGPDDREAPVQAERRTITEMVYVPDEVDDGVAFLNIEVPDFDLDAAPSRPLLYEAMPAD